MMQPNDASWMANSVNPDQTAPQGTVWSGSTLFAQAYLSKNLGSLQQCDIWLDNIKICDSNNSCDLLSETWSYFAGNT